MKNTYFVSIQSNTHSVDCGKFDTKSEAMKQAAYIRSTGGSWAGDFSEKYDAPVVAVYRNDDEAFYSKGLCKKAMRP